MQKLDIFGTGVSAISDTITAQRRVNVMYDFRADSENNPVVILPTPGLTPYVQLPFTGIRSMWQNGQYAFVAAGTGLFLITNNGYTELGTFGTAYYPNVFEMKTNLTQLVMVDGTSVWTFNIENLTAVINAPGQILSSLSTLQNVVNNMY